MRSILKMRIAFNYSTDADLGIFEQLGPASLRWLPGLGDRGAPCVETASIILMRMTERAAAPATEVDSQFRNENSVFQFFKFPVRKEKFPVMGFQIPCSLAQGIWPYALEFHR
jgi:hypothetical protein